MTEEKFEQIMDGDSGSFTGDNAMQGLLILAKYMPIETETLIQGAGHNEIWGPDISELIEAGITEEDVIQLRELNWMINDGEYLACFV